MVGLKLINGTQYNWLHISRYVLDRLIGGFFLFSSSVLTLFINLLYLLYLSSSVLPLLLILLKYFFPYLSDFSLSFSFFFFITSFFPLSSLTSSCLHYSSHFSYPLCSSPVNPLFHISLNPFILFFSLSFFFLLQYPHYFSFYFLFSFSSAVLPLFLFLL